MNGKNFLKVFIGSLSVIAIVAICLVSFQVRNDTYPNTFVNSDSLQNTSYSVNSLDEQPVSVKKQISGKQEVNINTPAQNSSNVNDGNNFESNVPDEEKFYTGPEDAVPGDNVLTSSSNYNHIANSNSDFTNQANEDNVWHKLDTNGILYVKSDGTVEEGYEKGSWHDKIYSIKKVEIINTVKPTITASWFSPAGGPGKFEIPRIESITGIENINMNLVTNASYMFCGIGLNACTISNINTWIESGNAKMADSVNCEGMFSNCQNEDLMSSISAMGIKPVSTTFMYNKSSIKSINMENWDLSSLSNPSYMFCNAKQLTTIDHIPTFNVEGKNLRSMFNDTAVSEIDLSNWSEPKSCSGNTDMTNLFRANSNLVTIRVAEGIDWSNCKELTGGEMFNGCENLVGCNGTTSNGAVKDKSRSRVDFIYHNINNTKCLFSGYFTAMNAKAVKEGTNLVFYHDDVNHNVNGNTVYSVPWSEDIRSKEARGGAEELTEIHWYDTRQVYTSVKFDKTFQYNKSKSHAWWFAQFSNCGSFINIKENLNTSESKSLRGLFHGCISTNFKSIDVSGFDTSKVVDMSHMFENVIGIEQIDISNFNLHTVEDMTSIFFCATEYMSLDCLTRVIFPPCYNDKDSYGENLKSLVNLFAQRKKLQYAATQKEIAYWDWVYDTTKKRYTACSLYGFNLLKIERMGGAFHSNQMQYFYGPGTATQPDWTGENHYTCMMASKAIDDTTGAFKGCELDAFFFGCTSLNRVWFRNVDISYVKNFREFYKLSLSKVSALQEIEFLIGIPGKALEKQNIKCDCTNMFYNADNSSLKIMVKHGVNDDWRDYIKDNGTSPQVDELMMFVNTWKPAYGGEVGKAEPGDKNHALTYTTVPSGYSGRGYFTVIQ